MYTSDCRQCVKFGRTGNQMDTMDEANRSEAVEPFLLGESGLAMGDCAHKCISPEQDVKRPSASRLLEQAHVGASKVIEPAADDCTLRGIVHDCLTLTLTRNAPGTDWSDTTYRYPPPQPEYMAPGYRPW